MSSKSDGSRSLTCLSVNQTPLDWDGNLDRILRALHEIRDACTKSRLAPPDLLLLPELAMSGYSCEDAFFSGLTERRAREGVLQLAKEADRILPGTLLFCGLPFFLDDANYNCMAALLGGRVVGLHAKEHLANEGLHYEARHFRAWTGGSLLVKMEPDGEEIPFGSPIYEYRGLRLGLEICRDSWVADRPMLGALGLGLDLILNPSASHFAFGKYDLRRKLAIESSRQFGCHFAQVNLLGNEAGRAIFDGSTLLASGGRLVYENKGFSRRDFSWQIFCLKTDSLRVARRRSSPARPEIMARSLQNALPAERWSPRDKIWKLDKVYNQNAAFAGFTSKAPAHEPNPDRKSSSKHSVLLAASEAPKPAVRNGRFRKFSEFLDSVTLGLLDYLRKSRSRGFVVSLSGGADSAACALLVERMIGFGIYRLGAQDFLARVGRSDLLPGLKHTLEDSLDNSLKDTLEKIPGDNHKAAKTDALANQPLLPKEILQILTKIVTGGMLQTIYQATAQSSETTREAARSLAEALGSTHSEAEIEGLVRSYRELAQAALGRELSWQTDDLTLQNIQARVRAPLAWMLANATGSLLLATGNRSECAVGYCTMDGDTAGGLSPIAGVSKPFILDFLKFMQEEGDEILGPVPALSLITKQQPTAELRPASESQTDESDLMPYLVLDRIEALAIHELKSPKDIYESLCHDEEFSGYPSESLKLWVDTFFRLWSRNQWKRERYAPSFHLDTYSLDPRGYFRFPILSGGYESIQQTDANS